MKKNKEIFLYKVQMLAKEYGIDELVVLVNSDKVSEMDNVINLIGNESSATFDLGDSVDYTIVFDREDLRGCCIGGSDLYYGDINSIRKENKIK